MADFAGQVTYAPKEPGRHVLCGLRGCSWSCFVSSFIQAERERDNGGFGYLFFFLALIALFITSCAAIISIVSLEWGMLPFKKF